MNKIQPQTRFDFEVSETLNEKKVRALTWIIEQASQNQPRPRDYSVRVVYSNDDIQKNQCATNEVVVSVSDKGLFRWFHPYSEPGAPPFSSHKLNSFFDFMCIAVYPCMVNGCAATWLMQETDLEEKYKAISREYFYLSFKYKELPLKNVAMIRKAYIATLQKSFDSKLAKSIGLENEQLLIEFIKGSVFNLLFLDIKV